MYVREQQGEMSRKAEDCNSTTGSHRSGGSTTTSAGAGRQLCGPNCGLGRLLRKLRKQSKMLCSAGRPASFQCQYDPLSYSRNFDRSGFGTALDDDATHFYHTFSSRFVNCSSTRAPSSAGLVASNH